MKSKTNSLTVLSIDPGIMTGYAQARIANGRLEYVIFQATDEVDNLWHRLKKLEPRFIVCESFEFRGGHQKAATGIEYFPIQLIGVARLYAEIADHQCACYLQSPAQGKGYYTNTMLKSLGLLLRGQATNVDHGVDALRHLLQWFTFGPGYQFNESAPKEFAYQLERWDDEF